MSCKKKDVMIDIETMSTDTNALILTIGAIKFDRTQYDKCDMKLDSFYRRMDVDTLDGVFHIDEKTRKWWNSQTEDVRYEALVNPDRIPLKTALLDFNEWFGKSRYVWANGSSFDIPILENAYKICDVPIPWDFWNVRDVRTIMDVANVRKSDIGINNAHNALYDCVWQVNAVKKSFGNISKRL